MNDCHIHTDSTDTGGVLDKSSKYGRTDATVLEDK